MDYLSIEEFLQTHTDPVVKVIPVRVDEDGATIVDVVKIVS